jgi:hypothetical protein
MFGMISMRVGFAHIRKRLQSRILVSLRGRPITGSGISDKTICRRRDSWGTERLHGQASASFGNLFVKSCNMYCTYTRRSRRDRGSSLDLIAVLVSRPRGAFDVGSAAPGR